METFKEITTTVEVIDDIFCNKCGNSCKSGSNFNGLIEVTAEGNYDSTHLEDLKTYTFSLCEKCLVELFATFQIKPKILDYLI
jgi:hypothetical protein